MVEICVDTVESEGEFFTTYGIIYDGIQYRDLCTDRARVEAFAEKVVKYDGFSLLEDLIADFIEEIYG